ncbi:SH3 type 3 domain protein [Planktothrix tepida]|uniref:SH3 type 3 domain protein n=1 Tax=Planktothrix tepida PCC 9214 TaxID=671072 RepID=A0A1J1LCN1_9CYAN
MSIKPSQLIIAGGIGVIAGVTIAVMTVQSPSSKSSPTPQTQSPRPSEPPITSVPASVPNTPPPSESRPIAVIKPPVEGCKVSTAVVKDPDPPLNVRSTPEVTEGNIVGQLNNNTFVFVIEEKSRLIACRLIAYKS